ncbi:hypothetical protein [Agromyces sp. SYSU T00194]
MEIAALTDEVEAEVARKWLVWKPGRADGHGTPGSGTDAEPASADA